MEYIIRYSFLFFIGATFGWFVEVLFRKFFSAENPEHKWINPGCCTGPYLPLYGVGVCVLYFISSLNEFIKTENIIANGIIMLILMTGCMTLLEYIAGVVSLKVYHVRLWDYSKNKGNIQGIICPLFTFFWAILCAIYYFLLHSHIAVAASWVIEHPLCYFALGIFFGVFVVDLIHSLQLMNKLKAFAHEHDIVLALENIKVRVRAYYDKTSKKYRFFRPFEADRSLHELLIEMKDGFEQRAKKIYKKSSKSNAKD